VTAPTLTKPDTNLFGEPQPYRDPGVWARVRFDTSQEDDCGEWTAAGEGFVRLVDLEAGRRDGSLVQVEVIEYREAPQYGENTENWLDACRMLELDYLLSIDCPAEHIEVLP
jgi:hypothetical protein